MKLEDIAVRNAREEIFRRPHRAILFVPPHNEKMRERIPDFGARIDCVLLNLEDAIAVNKKKEARDGAVQALCNLDFGTAVVMCRINGLGTEWYRDDLRAIMEASAKGTHLDVLMLPKVEGRSDIQKFVGDIRALEQEFCITKPTLIAAILETAKGVREVNAIAEASKRMHSIHIGPADLAASLGLKVLDVGGAHPDASMLVGPAPKDEEEDLRTQTQIDIWNPYVMALVVACKSADILPFYGPFGRVKDYRASLAQFRSMYVRGCIGAWALHPIQVDAAEEAFSPNSAELVQASAIAELMAAGEKRGDGAVMTPGGMLDEAVCKQAANFIRLSEQVALKDGRRGDVYKTIPGYEAAVAIIKARDSATA